MFQKRILRYFLALQLLSTIVLTLLFAFSFYRINHRNTVESFSAAAKINASALDDFYDYIYTSGSQIDLNLEFLDVLKIASPEKADSSGSMTILSNRLMQLSKYYPELINIFIIGTNGTAIKSSPYELNHYNYVRTDWFYDVLHSEDKLSYLGIYENSLLAQKLPDGVDHILDFAMPCTDPDTGDALGVLLFEVDAEYFKKMVSSQLELSEICILLDEEGSCIASTADEEATSSFLREYIYRINKGYAEMSRENKEQVSASTGNSLFIISEIKEYNWKIITNIPNSNLLRGVSTYYPMIISYLAVVIVLAVILSILLSRRVSRPIIQMTDTMQKAQDGFTELRLDINREDEFGKVSEIYNRLMDTLEEDREKIQIQQESQRIAELKALQAQINPHFLYNTLDTIIWLCRMEETEKATEITEALARIFRISLSKGNDIIPLENELQHVQSYLTIQKMRYMDLFTYEIQCDQRFYSCRIPKLILQPLVENSLYHGIKMKDEPGKIQIRVEEKESELLLFVEDDGCGMPPEIEETLRESLQTKQVSRKEVENETGSYGLLNVNERIRIAFGEKYGIGFETREFEGTTFWIKIPKITGQAF